MDAAWHWISAHGVTLASSILLVIDVALRVLAVFVVPRNRRPGSAIAWLLAIMVFPLVGFPLYLMLGKAQLPRKRREKQRLVNRLMHERAEEIPDSDLDQGSPSWLQSAVALNRNLGAFPLTGNNSVDLHIDYDLTIEEMARDIRTAERSVNAVFYTMGLDAVTADFFRAIGEAADRGVTVRLLYDYWGSAGHRRPYKAMQRFLDQHGIEHYPAMPIKPFADGAFQRPDLRNHRKILVIDGKVGWLGSQNVISRDYDKRSNIRRGLRWQETMARITGPIVSEMNLLFATDWYFESDEILAEAELVHPQPDTAGELECQIVPSGPGFVLENNLLLFDQLFYSAAERIVVVSPYFVPSESMLYALITAAGRGVDVELIVSSTADQFLVGHAQRSYYEELLVAGVRIQLYEEPYILHAKHVTIDDFVTVIGSSNMDIRSFLLDMESSLMIGGSDFMQQMRDVEAVYRERSTRLDLETWRRRPFLARSLDDICRMASSIV
ncbi:cardiolipin synthase [Brachybacterium huguangmaarense]|uniref:Cardiolipin synthase n=1 Tax=Brachybacterium huguangmaarense TaxID=1652028 RepID=A0ABY6G1T2_9MICO|nr:cardiolipin synthase [Brachybacterium huguangmaarense]UYG17159.1 cardiolipin synthase [Brachybacterium huguangmaarense]